jgi:hypothetical protein
MNKLFAVLLLWSGSAFATDYAYDWTHIPVYVSGSGSITVYGPAGGSYVFYDAKAPYTIGNPAAELSYNIVATHVDPAGGYPPATGWVVNTTSDTAGTINWSESQVPGLHPSDRMTLYWYAGGVWRSCIVNTISWATGNSGAARGVCPNGSTWSLTINFNDPNTTLVPIVGLNDCPLIGGYQILGDTLHFAASWSFSRNC